MKNLMFAIASTALLAAGISLGFVTTPKMWSFFLRKTSAQGPHSGAWGCLLSPQEPHFFPRRRPFLHRIASLCDTTGIAALFGGKYA